MIIAGPGTGKTHTLVRRVGALLDTGDLAAGGDLLVLSFTRAVVGELRRRLGEHPAARFVRPVTIDGHASRLVGRHDGQLPCGGFDTTVRRATTLIREVDEGPHRHVIVDEAQDLAEPRLSFVAEVLVRADGFTVLGDPAQGIYGFQCADSPDALAALRARFPDAQTFSLSVNHRVRSPRGDLAGWAHDTLAHHQNADLRLELAQALRDATRVSIEQLALVLRMASGGTAVVCRTNGEILVLSEMLRERNVAHRVQRAAASMVPPRWIAETLAGCAEQRLSRRGFMNRTEAAQPDWQTASWRALRRVAAGSGDDVELPRLRERVRGITEQEAPDADPLDLPVLSTVHRAKGLEFDRVAVLEPSLAEQEGLSEEGRVLFVAMTRARDETLMLERPKSNFRLQQRFGRWMAVPWRKQGIIGIEVRPGDVDRQTPFSDEWAADAVQGHLSARVRPGDAVTLRRSTGEARYVVLHDEKPIATMGVDFVADLERLGGVAAVIRNVYVDSLSTAAGDPSLTDNLGLGPGGFWLVPELVGLGRLVWRTE